MRKAFLAWVLMVVVAKGWDWRIVDHAVIRVCWINLGSTAADRTEIESGYVRLIPCAKYAKVKLAEPYYGPILTMIPLNYQRYR
jgi:hypothetical protein